MVKKIIGYNDKDEIVFERDARAYDKEIANTVFGITIGDVIKTVPVIFFCGIVYANQLKFNEQMLISNTKNSEAIGGIKEVLSNLNNYLSPTTGKRFKNGEPL